MNDRSVPPSTPGALLGAAFSDLAARWPLVLVRMGQKVAVTFLLGIGLAPFFFPIFRYAFQLAAEAGGGTVPDIDPEEITSLFAESLPWFGLGCLTLLLLGTLAGLFSFWVRGGILAEFASPEPGFSGSRFSAAGRRFFWRVTAINVAFHVTGMVLAAIAGFGLVAVAILLGMVDLAGGDASALPIAFVVVAVLLVVILILPVVAFFHFAEAIAVAADRSVGEAFAGVFASLRRRPLEIAATLGGAAVVGLVFFGGMTAFDLVLDRATGGLDGAAACGTFVAWLAFAAVAFVLGTVFEVWIFAVLVRLAKLGLGLDEPVPPPPSEIPSPVPAFETALEELIPGEDEMAAPLPPTDLPPPPPEPPPLPEEPSATQRPEPVPSPGTPPPAPLDLEPSPGAGPAGPAPGPDPEPENRS